jgi:predicted small secreted protein
MQNKTKTLHKLSSLILALFTLSLSGCVVVEGAGTAARVVGGAVSTAVDVTGDVVGGAVRTVTGGGDEDSDGCDENSD